MNKIQKTKEKVCTFYVSDYHFEMKALPYISENLKKEKSITILTENDLEETIRNLMSRTNLNESKKNEILNINWDNNNEEKLKKLKEDIQKEKEILIFIKGKENYIKKTNENLIKYLNNYNKIKIIDCYDMEEIGEKIDNIVEDYNIILNTSGEKEIEKNQ